MEELQSFRDSTFARLVAPVALGVFLLGYFLQAVIAWNKAREVVPGLSENAHPLTLWDVVKRHDGGLPNAWAFAVIAIGLPVFLSLAGDMSSLMSANVLDQWTALWYFGSFAAICALITLEISYVHNLRVPVIGFQCCLWPLYWI